MDVVQVVGFMLQLMTAGPDMQRMSAWYRGAWERVRAFFRRSRESTQAQFTSHVAGC
jgi:hypothetical protein